MQLLTVTPEDEFVLYALAIEHAKGGNHQAAISFFDRAIATDPANAYHHFHKARSLEALDEIEQAQATLREGLRVARQHGDQKASSEIIGYLDMISG